MHSTFRATIAFYFLRECVLIIRKHPVITQKVGILVAVYEEHWYSYGAFAAFYSLFGCFEIETVSMVFHYLQSRHDVFKTLSP